MDDLDLPSDSEYLDYMRMWSKRYLMRVRSCIHTIKMIRSEIAELDEMLDGLKAVDYSAVRTAGAASDDAMVARIERIGSLKREFETELDANLQAHCDAHRALRHVRQPWRAVLTYRYLEGLTWAAISERSGYSEIHCKTELHTNGLIELFPYIPHEYDEFPEAI